MRYNGAMPIPRRFTTEAVVLRSLDIGEADRLLSLYTPQYGKLRGLAKGVRKPRSRKAGHLISFARTRVLLAQGQNLFLITQAEGLDLHPNLHQDLQRFALAAYVVELLDRFTYEGEPQPRAYRLLVDTLARLDQGEPGDLTVRYYELHLLDLMGYRPELFHCLACGAVIQPEPQYFSAEQGGVLCPSCGSRFPEARPISLDALKYLRHFQRSSFSQARRARPTAPVWVEMARVLQHYLTHILERRPNASRFLNHLHRQPPS